MRATRRWASVYRVIAGMARSYPRIRLSGARSAINRAGMARSYSALGICLSRYRGHGPLVPGNVAFWGTLCNQSSDSGCVHSR